MPDIPPPQTRASTSMRSILSIVHLLLLLFRIVYYNLGEMVDDVGDEQSPTSDTCNCTEIYLGRIFFRTTVARARH